MADTDTDTDIVMALTDDALGRLIADTALRMAQAQLLPDAALDELARRQEPPSERAGRA